MASDIDCVEEHEREESVRRDQWDDDGSQQQLAHSVFDRVDGGNCARQQQYDIAICRAQTLGSAQLSQLAMIEASDSISPDCLTAVGQYRAARTQNATAVSTLAADELDGSDASNSEVQQLNLLNAAEAQKMAEMQTQGTLQACLAAQMAVANMERRNAAAIDLNTAGFVQQQRTTNNVNAAERKQYLADLSAVN